MKTDTSLVMPRVLIVGAGPAGLGVSLALKHAGVTDQLVVDASEVGASFAAWPKGMALLSPSFNSNSFGLTDLNAIDPFTSPADFFKTQHPTGHSYARYLQVIVDNFQLPVSTGIKVESVEKTEEGFSVQTSDGEIRPEYLIWAGGQFSLPKVADFPGSELALHSSKVEDWSKLEGENYVVIGGYESGIDAAINLIENGKSVRLITRGQPWTVDHPDPSVALSPRTFDRLRQLLKDPDQGERLELISDTSIKSIEKIEDTWILRDQDEIPMGVTSQPILANGFHSGLGLVCDLFDYDENDLPIFSEEADESTITSNLFYTGPSLVHRNALFCFIYKFRARFAVIASEIAYRLDLPDVEEKLEAYSKGGFMNRDLDCCSDCECAITPSTEDTPSPDSFQNQN